MTENRRLNVSVIVPRPEGVPSHTALASHPELRPPARYGLPGEMVEALSPHTEADPAGILVSFLVGFGNAVGPPGPFVRAGGVRHPARLSAVLVGDTSRSRKGTAWAMARKVLAEASPRWAEDRIASGLSSGEGLIEEVRDGRSEEDPGALDKRLLVFEAEFARVLSVASREGSILSAVLRSAWDDGVLRTLVRHNPLRASGAHISVLGHITREELLRRLSDTEAANGFANRFLFVAVKRSKLLPAGGNPPEDTVRALAAKTAEALRSAVGFGEVHRTPEAETLWAQMYAEMAESPPGLVGAITARAEAQALRLSLTYALLDGARVIDVPHLQAGYAVWRYAEDSARFVFGDATGDPTADRILSALHEAGSRGMDLQELRDLFGRHSSANRRRDAALLALERSGLVVKITEPTGGRDRTVYYATQATEATEGART